MAYSLSLYAVFVYQLESFCREKLKKKMRIVLSRIALFWF